MTVSETTATMPLRDGAARRLAFPRRTSCEGSDPHSRGYKKLKAEIEHLSTERRREVAERIRVARQFEDIAENAE